MKCLIHLTVVKSHQLRGHRTLLVATLMALITRCTFESHSNCFTQAFSLNSRSQQLSNKSHIRNAAFQSTNNIHSIQGRHRSTFELSSTALSSNNNGSEKKKKLSRPERKALERKKKQQQKNNRNNKSNTDNRKYNLHSRKVSALCKSESTADDVITAIKRAQNRHDVHDIRNIAKFLLDEVEPSFAYGFRGSLLARLAVAALHMSEHDSAKKAIEIRKKEHKSSIMPMESAAIIRGLLRVHNVTDAMSILEDELTLPEVSTMFGTV